MRQGIHPQYVDTQVTCGCGNQFTTRSTKARDELDYQAVPLRPMVEESWHWLKEQGLL